jgi:hypothetical protein
MSNRSKKKLRGRMNYRAEADQPAMNYRSASFHRRADGFSTLDEKERSVEVIMASEEPARVYDYERGVINEVLLMSGAQLPASNQLVLLDAHSRYETANVIGSARQIKLKDIQMIGRAFYSSAPEAESPWIKTREGHLTDYSIGYRVDEAVWIGEGKTEIIHGKSFTGPLQVVTKWTPRELSAVPIGADQNAKARSEIHQPSTSKEVSIMDPKIRAMLEAKGLPATATEEEAIAFLGKLEAKRSETPAQPSEDEKKRNEDKIRAEATGAERERIREIDSVCQRYDCADMARDLIIGGKAIIDAQRAVLDKIQERSKKENPGVTGVFAGDDQKDKFRAAAQDALILRTGISVEKPAPGASELRGYTLAEMARECLRMANMDHRGSTKEMVGRALTSSDFPYILANLATKSMQQGWDTAEETWPVWTGEGSVSDFKTYYDNGLSEHDDLDEIPDSGEMKFGGFSEKAPETYKIASYGKKFKVTRVMIINDDLRALTELPAKRTEAANRKIGDIVYAIITANGNMGDGNAIFDSANHANDAISGVKGVVGITTIAAGILAMGTHKDIAGKRRLNIRPQFFMAPKAIEGSSEIFFRSGNFSDTNTIATDSSLASTRVNPYGGNYLNRVYEPRLDDDSVTAWYLMGPKGKTVKVVFLNGQKGPILEMIQPGFSVEGFEYAVVIDAGAYATDYRGLYRNEGA